ncbi:PilW family protein [Cryobacterium luteum]|uniref:Uncharacterized protein n=1 Tax=Cryobacterium luteum TaxID=1424661 RepID=A0A1H8C0P1_9MICO|nr:hypothetical protein [Cryobacterium luteum]TFB89205.1 hypothetical protein E3O10_10000 [Cryobacterium luteum]SEM88626.1 hypothetical protein SAMN05216281_102192 [Cryobacterium luteum]
MFTPRTAPIAEQGFTLVELLIYSAFSVIILSLVGGMLVTSLSAQKTMIARSEAASAGQLISQSIHSGVRNANAIKIVSPVVGSEMLIMATVQTGDGETGESCQAWFYTAADGGAVYYKSAAAGELNFISPPAAGSFAGWLMLGDDISPSEASRPFFLGAGSPLNEVAVSFTVGAGSKNAPILIESTTITRQSGSESSACFN